MPSLCLGSLATLIRLTDKYWTARVVLPTKQIFKRLWLGIRNRYRSYDDFRLFDDMQADDLRLQGGIQAKIVLYLGFVKSIVPFEAFCHISR